MHMNMANNIKPQLWNWIAYVIALKEKTLK